MKCINFKNIKAGGKRFNIWTLVVFYLLLIGYGMSSYAGMEEYLHLDNKRGGLVFEIPNGTEIDKAKMDEIIKILGNTKRPIVSFSIGGNNSVGGADVLALLAHALERDSALTAIDIVSNRIGDEGARAIASALERNTTLTTIDLSHNRIGDEGARAIASALERNTALTTIDLSHNYIGNAGARAFAHLLERNTPLTAIIFYDNMIGNEGARAIASALGQNATLEIIDFSGNNISDEGASAIASALVLNTALTVIKLAGQEINDRISQMICFILERNDLLRQLARTVTTGVLYTQLDQMPMDLINIMVAYATIGHSSSLLAMIMDGSISNHLDAATINNVRELINRIRGMQENILKIGKMHELAESMLKRLRGFRARREELFVPSDARIAIFSAASSVATEPPITASATSSTSTASDVSQEERELVGRIDELDASILKILSESQTRSEHAAPSTADYPTSAWLTLTTFGSSQGLPNASAAPSTADDPTSAWLTTFGSSQGLPNASAAPSTADDPTLAWLTTFGNSQGGGSSFVSEITSSGFAFVTSSAPSADSDTGSSQSSGSSSALSNVETASAVSTTDSASFNFICPSNFQTS